MVTGADRFFSAMARAPMLRMVGPFVVGIIIAMRWSLPLPVLLVILALVTLVTVFIHLRGAVFGRRWTRGVASMGWFFIFGLCWQVIRDPLTKPTHVSGDGTTEVERVLHITTINGISEKVIRADARVVAALVDGEAKERTGQLMLTLLRQPDGVDPVAGDEVVIRSRAKRPRRVGRNRRDPVCA